MKIVETESYNNTPTEPEQQDPIVQENPDENLSPIPKGTEVWWRYGNYCGPGPLRNKTCDKLINGHPLPGAKDEVDQACMDHDLEYCQNGLGWKDAYLLNVKSQASVADKQLIENLRKLEISSSLNWKQKMAAKTIIGYFSLRNKFLSKPQQPQQLPSFGNG